MRTNKDFVKRNIGGENILVAVGDASKIFNGMISLNTVASFIWDNVDECGDVDKLVMKRFYLQHLVGLGNRHRRIYGVSLKMRLL